MCGLMDRTEHTAQVCERLCRLGIPAEREVSLREHTTFRIGGPAEVLVEVTSAEQLALVLRVGHEVGLPVRCLGGGSNVLVSDEGVPGIVALNRIGHLMHEDRIFRVGGGVGWDELVLASVERGLAGMAAMSGIPGSVGGAIYGNAGAYGESVGDSIVSATVLTPSGDVRTLSRAELCFRYRHSRLKETGEIVVEATFALRPGDRLRLKEERETILQTRAAKLPAKTEATAGSFFKNIEDAVARKRLIEMLGLPDDGHRIASGLLLDRVGARGMSVGDAVVFSKHANIIVNRGAATAGEVLELSRRMHAKVREAFGISLEREVIWVGLPEPGSDAPMGRHE